VSDNVQTLSSLRAPLRLTFSADNGLTYSLLLKYKVRPGSPGRARTRPPHGRATDKAARQDDLRLDSRLLEFDAVVNKLLSRDPEARRRNLRAPRPCHRSLAATDGPSPAPLAHRHSDVLGGAAERAVRADRVCSEPGHPPQGLSASAARARVRPLTAGAGQVLETFYTEQGINVSSSIREYGAQLERNPSGRQPSLPERKKIFLKFKQKCAAARARPAPPPTTTHRGPRAGAAGRARAQSR
jgi:hypothetical protein